MLKVNEIFGPTIQGEGKTAGQECLFVRLAFCNLRCVWCDTPHTWNFGKTAHLKSYDISQEVHEMTSEGILCALLDKSTRVQAVVITGGEPLVQQKQLLDLVFKLKMLGFWVEVETNGSIVPDERIVRVVNQFNCSPKLTNSGNDTSKSIVPEALQSFVKSGKTFFKFVYSDITGASQICDLVSRFQLRDVFVMPEGRTNEELNAKEKEVRAFCELNGFQFCPRLHIQLFGGKRGV